MLALLLAGACLTSPRLPETVAEGTWGGDDAGLIVRNDGAHAHIGCTLGNAPAPFPLDGEGRFEVMGQWNVNAYPIDLGIVHPARISGRTDGRRLIFSVVLTDTGQTLGPALVTFGREPRMANCPICRVPDRSRAPKSPWPASQRLGDVGSSGQQVPFGGLPAAHGLADEQGPRGVGVAVEAEHR